MTTGPLLVLGSGDRALREYALAGLRTRGPLALLGYHRPTWEAAYVDAYACVDLQDPDFILREARKFHPSGIVTYDDRLVEHAAVVAETLGLPGPSVDAVAICKDKGRFRGRLADAGLSPVGFQVCATVADAVAAAARIGYPVVLKPRTLSGSIGVVRAADEHELRLSFRVAAEARAGLLASAQPGVLLEEYLDGPEYSVDSVTCGGHTRHAVVAEKTVGFAPYFEELGHLVPAPASPDLSAALDLVTATHRAVGLDNLATHTEFRLTASGPRIIELNARLGGGLIPYAGRLALGVDLPGAVADVALGRDPTIRATADEVAAVAMCYPPYDMTFESVEMVSEPPGLELFVALSCRGQTLRLPPRGFLSRVAAAVVRAPDHPECMRRLALVRERLLVRGAREPRD